MQLLNQFTQNILYSQDILTYGSNVNNFLKMLKTSLPSAFISTVIADSLIGTNPWKRKTSRKETEELLNYVDQVIFLYYDTDIHDQKNFQANCDQLICDIKAFKSTHKQLEFLVAIGTFINDREIQHYHDPYIESISNSVQTINNSINRICPNDTIINGLSIFCEWETDKTEWLEFYQKWVKQ